MGTYVTLKKFQRSLRLSHESLSLSLIQNIVLLKQRWRKSVDARPEMDFVSHIKAEVSGTVQGDYTGKSTALVVQVESGGYMYTSRFSRQILALCFRSSMYYKTNANGMIKTYEKKPIKVKINGQDYWFQQEENGGGPVAPLEHCFENGELNFATAFGSETFAHVFPNRVVSRYGVNIGSIDEFITNIPKED